MATLPIDSASTDAKIAAVKGECTGAGGFGVWGICATGHGIHGDSTSSRGVVGTSQSFHGVFGNNTTDGGVGVMGSNPKGAGVDGALCECGSACDKRVAGVVSGAGDYKPGIVLDSQPGPGPRQPIALMGKVFCKADARFGAIAIGDLLTTSVTPGHAMKASEGPQAFGAVIGKAMRPLASGQGLIPILIALQ
jgi:hypothetical protein